MTTGLFRKKPPVNWLGDLNKYRNDTKPGKHPHLGPWYSDDGEDGVLDYIFQYINITNRFAVDIGCAHGYGGSHIRHLVDKYDMDSTELDYNRDWDPIHPRVKQAWVTPDNICEILELYKTPKEFDLLSLDVDSTDYYILQEILQAKYRYKVAIIEYNPIFNYDECYVKKYDTRKLMNLNYIQEFTLKDSTSSYGASLMAYSKLMNRAGYELVHAFGESNLMESNNAIFIHKEFLLDDAGVQSIKVLHPLPWIESWKTANPNLSLEDIRGELLKTEFVEVT